jgi:hypothetical protein
MDPIHYKGHTIQIDPVETDNWRQTRFVIFPTNQGIDHDGDFDGESWHYCGNCKWAGSIEDAKDQIDEMSDDDSSYYASKNTQRHNAFRGMAYGMLIILLVSLLIYIFLS